MNFEVQALGGVNPAPVPSRPPRSAASQGAAASPAVTLDLSVGSPPPNVFEEMEAAAQRVDELRALGRELHFQPNHPSGRIIIEVRDLDGNVIRTVPPAEALEIALGAPIE